MIKLRDYQEKCVNNIMNMNNGSRKIACLPTGSGKTILMSEICRRAKGRILIVVISTELRKQTIDKLHMVCGNNISVGCIQSNIREYNTRITIATRQTLTSNSFSMKDLLQYGEYEYILIDECHTGVKQCKDIIDTICTDNTKVVGFTATPYNSQLKNLYYGFVYKRELIDMIKEGYLIDPICYSIKTDISLDNIKVRNNDFITKKLAETININTRNKLIYNAYINKCKDRNKTIIFATDINHSKAIAEYFCNNGISAKSIDGSLNKKEREQIFKDFETGKIKVLVNVMICTIGLDIPSIDSIIFARPTQSKALYIQMLGRGLRLSPETNKKDCVVIDIVDFVSKHNLMNSKTIFDTNDGETITKAKNRKIVVKTKNNSIDKFKNKLDKNNAESIVNNIIDNSNINYIETDLFNAENKDSKYNNSVKNKDDNDNNSNKNCNKDNNIKDTDNNKPSKNNFLLVINLLKKIFNLKAD